MPELLTLQRHADSENAMVALGQALGELLLPGMLVALHGDLGAGKTTLSRGVLRAFGHSGAVKSPTYTLVEPYSFGDTTVYHFDLYRLGEAEELEYLGIRDYFDGHSIALVEWPERGADS
ncbi:MAG: tRNA (adenosine(37)-N6)-threonylcarbamoyltransferase complex ATPase subunit type 1 TsaE, partial [Pseudomonadota bacterium]